MTNTILGMKILQDNSLAVNYNVADLPVYIAKEALMNFPDKKNIPHWNEGLETIYIKEGQMNLVVHGERVLLKEHEFGIIHPGCVHYFESIDDQNCIYYCGVVEEKLFPATEEITRKYIETLFHPLNPDIDILPADSEYNTQIRSLYNKANSLRIDKPVAYDLQITACVYETLALLCKALDHPRHLMLGLNQKSEESICKMIRYIQQNYGASISVADLCAAGYVSRNQCFQLFQQYIEETPANFIRKYRLNMAKNQLKDNTRTISEVAHACGFAHQSHFTNQFSKYYGVTPFQYRKLIFG